MTLIVTRNFRHVFRLNNNNILRRVAIHTQLRHLRSRTQVNIRQGSRRFTLQTRRFRPLRNFRTTNFLRKGVRRSGIQQRLFSRLRRLQTIINLTSSNMAKGVRSRNTRTNPGRQVIVGRGWIADRHVALFMLTHSDTHNTRNEDTSV